MKRRIIFLHLHLLLTLHCHVVLAETFTGKVVGVSDGDTITVMHEGRGVKIRLYGIDCPEKKQDFGQRAKKETSALVFGKEVIVFSQGNDRYGRTLGVVELSGGRTLNHVLVGRGMCWWYERYAPNDIQAKNLQEGARKEKLGLWEMPNPTPPWEFRKVAKENARIPQPPSQF